MGIMNYKRSAHLGLMHKYEYLCIRPIQNSILLLYWFGYVPTA